MNSFCIRHKDRDAVIQSLRAGVVPRHGQHLIQVGRVNEVLALIKDFERMSDGGSSVRFIIGDYGCGKTFFLNLMCSVAMEKRFVVARADLSPDRRIHGSGGQARALYAELMQNIATRSKPEGGALESIVERFISESSKLSREQKVSTEEMIFSRLNKITELVGGYDFAHVISSYFRGFDTDNLQLSFDAIRWLRGEFTTKTEARASLGVRTIIDDETFYDHLKLMAHFIKLSGYDGFLVCLDELVNLYKLANTQARNSNYEQILRILNDCLQGSARGLGIFMGGTPEFLMDTRRGLYSYPALQSRLAPNTFASNNLVDFSGPVLKLNNLSPEDFYILLNNIRRVFAFGQADSYLIPDNALTAFMEHCHKRIGEAYFKTPRTTITAFVNLLSILEQNPHAKWTELLQGTNLKSADDPNMELTDNNSGEDDELASFRL